MFSKVIHCVCAHSFVPSLLPYHSPESWVCLGIGCSGHYVQTHGDAVFLLKANTVMLLAIAMIKMARWFYCRFSIWESCFWLTVKDNFKLLKTIQLICKLSIPLHKKTPHLHLSLCQIPPQLRLLLRMQHQSGGCHWFQEVDL